MAKDKQYKDLPKRITRDDHLVKVTSKWLRLSINIFTNLNHLFIDRLSHHRGNMCTVTSDHTTSFQLGIDEEYKEALKENNLYRYPGDWGVAEKGSRKSAIPYC